MLPPLPDAMRAFSDRAEPRLEISSPRLRFGASHLDVPALGGAMTLWSQCPRRAATGALRNGEHTFPQLLLNSARVVPC
jgi:hypothetical protein